MRAQRLFRLSLIVSLLVITQAFSPAIQVARADGFIDFENGLDGQPIRSTIPGLQFTTTEGYDWVYGDWRTGDYNGPYPNGAYSSNGNFFAWLGPNQGKGRIDFTKGGATYIQVWVSSAYGLYADAYDGMGNLLTSAYVDKNLNTGSMVRLRVDAPTSQKIAYVIFHDTGNYWLIDDLSTDAAGVPAQRPPVIVIPGIMGSQLDYYNTLTRSEGAVWPPLYDPNTHTVDVSGQIDYADLVSRLLPMMLSSDGTSPALPHYRVYSTAVLDDLNIKQKDTTSESHPYRLLVDRLKKAGFKVYEYDYDWRQDVKTPWHGQGKDGKHQSLDEFIDGVLAETGATKVNIVAHSLGGLVTRAYVSESFAHAAKVEQAVILGTPYFGAPQAFAALRSGLKDMNDQFSKIPFLDVAIKTLVGSYTSVYEIVPSSRYWDVADNWYYMNGRPYTPADLLVLLMLEHNGGLAKKALELHQTVDYWSDLPAGVSFRLIVGSGLEGTIGGLKAQKDKWPWSGTRWDIIPTNGDGTVPLASASLQGNGVNYSGGVPIWYANGVDHGGLTGTDYILDFVAAMLATPPNTQAMARVQHAAPASLNSELQLYQGATIAAAPHQAVTAPPVPPQMSETPFPLDGAQISVFHAAALHLYDSAGHHTGPKPDGSFELSIPGSSYAVIESGIFATVPAGKTYQVEVVPQGDQQFDFQVRDVEGLDTHFIKRTLLYDAVQVGPAGSASLSVNPTNLGTTPMMGLDLNGDGQVDKQMPPSSDLDSSQSYDFQPPQTTITAEGAHNARGWYTGKVRITIATTDDGTGVASVNYSLDDGRTLNPYSGPFEVVAEVTPSITADTFDHAGNHGTAHIRLIPLLNMLPSVSLSANLPPPSTWHPTTGLSGRIVYDIGTTNANCSTIFAAVSDGVYCSTDSGQNWYPLAVPGMSAAEAATVPAFDGGASPDAGLKPALGVCSTNSSVIYVGGWGNGIYRTTDGGNTWQARNNGLSDPRIYDVAVDPNNCSVVYAASNESGVFKTTDGGASWQARNGGLQNLLTRSLAITPDNPNRLYVGTSSGIYRSDNGAVSWVAAGPLPDATVWALAAPRGNTDTIYAGVYGYGVYRSTGGGLAWQTQNAGLGNLKVRALAIDPLNTQILYVGLEDGGGVYRSTNGADSWAALNNGFSNQSVKSLWQDGGSCHLLLAGTTDGAWYYGP